MQIAYSSFLQHFLTSNSCHFFSGHSEVRSPSLFIFLDREYVILVQTALIPTIM